MKRLLIIGASDFQLPAIIAAKEMGMYVGVADYNPNAVGIPFADEYFNVSTIDAEGICQSARDFKADGIVTLCTDMPMRALAYTCETLGLVGPDQEIAYKATDKYQMIKAFEATDVQHPAYSIVQSKREADKICAEFPVPAITKPTDNSGSRGIMLVEEREKFSEAITYSSENGRDGTVIVEEYMQGPETSVELMVIEGKAHVLQVTDKITTGAPHFVEIGHSQPSQLPTESVQKIKDLAMRAALAVGIKNGPAHAEVILTEDGPKMVEIGARMGGGCITTHLVPLSTGISMTRATIQVAMGEKPDLVQKIEKGSAIKFIIPPVGKVVSISGKEEAEQIAGIKLVDIQCEIGQILTELENGTCRIGYVIAQADTPQEALAICDKALNEIHIEVE